jgi:hypothetical protein
MFDRKTTTILAATALAAAVAFVAAGPSQGSASLPITACGQWATTNAVLMQDLDCAGFGIGVGASGITIDLKDHTVKGNGTGAGIYNPNGYDHVTTRNGVLRNFNVGIRFWNADYAKVSDVVVSGNTQEGLAIDGNHASITSSTASANGNTGFIVTGESAGVASSTAAGNSIYGVSVNGGGASVKSSTVSGNGWAGVSIHGDAAKIKGNRVSGNGFAPADGSGPGISVVATIAPVGSNVAHGNDDAGECHPASLC